MKILMYILFFVLIVVVAYLVDLVLTMNQLLDNILAMVGMKGQEGLMSPVPTVETVVAFLLSAMIVIAVIHVTRSIKRGED